MTNGISLDSVLENVQGFGKNEVNQQRSLSSIHPDEIYASDIVLSLHKWVLYVAWGVIADISIQIARYHKTWKHYMTAHTILFFIVDLSTIIVVMLMLSGNSTKLQHTEEMTSNTKVHYIIGLIFLVIEVVLHVLGVILKRAIEGNNPHVQTIKRAHIVLGILLFILCKVNLMIGTYIQDNLFSGIISMVMTCLTFCVSEFLYRYNNAKQSSINNALIKSYQQIDTSSLEENNTDDQNHVMRLLNQERLDTDKILAAVPAVKWVVYRTGVYDITGFIHPGGQFLIHPIIGREISRYMNGSLPLERYKGLTKHTHSAKAMHFLQSMLIGYLEYDDSCSLVVADDGQQQLIGKQMQSQLRSFNSFELVKTEVISSHTSLFRFQHNNKDGENTLQVRNVLKGVHWIGRHFALKMANQSKTRLYTQIICMTDDNVNLRNHLIALTEAKLLANSKKSYSNTVNNLPKLKQLSVTLPLVIKANHASKAGLSQKIHALSSKAKYEIQGPLGTGLGFTDRTANMRFGIFVSGTGVLPFLDLLDVLLKKTMVQLTQDANLLDPFRLGYATLFAGCQFTMYASFNQIVDFVGGNWICRLQEFSERLGNNIFKLHLKIKKGPTIPSLPQMKFKNFQELIKHTVDVHSFDKIYICGPPSMHHNVMSTLKQQGITEQKIFHV